MTGSNERMSAAAAKPWRTKAYRAGAGVAMLASFLMVWTTIVRDDGHAVGFFLVILAVGVGGFSALLEPAGMARTLLGVAIMQALWGIAVATAPIVANEPGGSVRALLYSAFFTALWLISGAFFRSAAQAERKASPTF